LVCNNCKCCLIGVGEEQWNREVEWKIGRGGRIEMWRDREVEDDGLAVGERERRIDYDGCALEMWVEFVWTESNLNIEK